MTDFLKHRSLQFLERTFQGLHARGRQALHGQATRMPVNVDPRAGLFDIKRSRDARFEHALTDQERQIGALQSFGRIGDLFRLDAQGFRKREQHGALFRARD